ncbi:MAG TPA: hypothetical protein VIH59_31000 [Candidatus Tectomicrobia bacterium]|jgi:hypothetical protein
MEFSDILEQVVHLLRSHGQVFYRALKDELIQAQCLAVDEEGAVLVWSGEPIPAPPSTTPQERTPLGALYGQTGRMEQARTALATAIDLYRTMEITFYLTQARAAWVQVAGSGLQSACCYCAAV